MTMSNAELLPCPFCGGPALLWTYRGKKKMACCDDSECPGREVVCPVDTWNHRPSLETLSDRVTERKFKLRDRVTKLKGSSWTGRVVGFYSTSLTPIGYAVESENEPGSVQIYPEAALAGILSEQELLDGINSLASHEPAPTDTQEGLSEAGEVVAWRNWNQLHECYYLDEVRRGILKVHDEKNEPLVRQSALTACQQEVERLREVLEPFALVAEHDIGEGESDDDIFWPISNARYSMAGRLRVGHLRRARAALGGQSDG